MFMQGCGGSANPYPRGSLTWAKAHGSELAGEVNRVLANTTHVLEPRLATVLGEIDLPLARTPTEEELARLESSRGGWKPWVAEQIRARVARDGKLPAHYRSPQAVWQIGTLTLVALSGEVVVDYVPLIEQVLGPLDLWVAAYSNDVFGYLPSAKVIAEGGYETRGLYSGGAGFFSPEAERTLVDGVRALAEEAGRK